VRELTQSNQEPKTEVEVGLKTEVEAGPKMREAVVEEPMWSSQGLKTVVAEELTKNNSGSKTEVEVGPKTREAVVEEPM
jgi:hypothetical protein